MKNVSWARLVVLHARLPVIQLFRRLGLPTRCYHSIRLGIFTAIEKVVTVRRYLPLPHGAPGDMRQPPRVAHERRFDNKI